MDIEPPPRVGPIDIASLTNVEVRAVLTHLCGSSDPSVREALLAAVQQVLMRTRL
jgi:hypothetical protein